MKSSTLASLTIRRRGQSMIAILVVVVVALVMALFFLGARRGPEGEIRPSVAKESMNRANDVSLESNLSQIRQIISMYKGDNEGRPPASLDELKRYAKFPAEMWVDPTTNRPLQYDPQTGNIWSDTQPPAGAPAPGAPASGAPAPAAPAPGAVPAVPAPGGNISEDLLN